MRTAWASGFTRFTGAVGFLSLIPNIFAMKRYMEKQLEAVRIRGGEGLVAELVRVEKEGGQISRNEMVAMLFLLLFAGHETTTHLISVRHQKEAIIVDARIPPSSNDRTVAYVTHPLFSPPRR
jgi:hypothetical protein